MYCIGGVREREIETRSPRTRHGSLFAFTVFTVKTYNYNDKMYVPKASKKKEQGKAKGLSTFKDLLSS